VLRRSRDENVRQSKVQIDVSQNIAAVSHEGLRAEIAFRILDTAAVSSKSGS